MTIFKHSAKQQPQLDIEQAGKILENVFEANHAEPNSVPLETLTAYSNYRKERFILQRTIIVVIMVVFFMLPFLFIPPDFTLKTASEANMTNPTYTLTVTSHMPVKRITAAINGHTVPVYEMDAHVYSIEPAVNGQMKITVDLINHQKKTVYVDVKNVDLDPPVVVSTDFDSDHVYLYLSDKGSGIDYENITVTGLNGETIRPLSWDPDTGCVVFPYPDTTWNVYIPDFAANQLQLVLSTK